MLLQYVVKDYRLVMYNRAFGLIGYVNSDTDFFWVHWYDT